MANNSVSWRLPNGDRRQFGTFLKYMGDYVVIRQGIAVLHIPKQYVTFERG